MTKTERWQCGRNRHTSLCPNQGTIMASFYADSSQQTRVCSCCSDLCNSKVDFCTEDLPIIRKIKKMLPAINPTVSRKTTGKNLQCFKADLQETNFFDDGHPQSLFWKFLNSAKSTRERCSACRKMSFTTRHINSGNIEYDKHEWRCSMANQTCMEMVSVTVSDDLSTQQRVECTCCSDKCNDAHICNLLNWNDDPSGKTSTRHQFLHLPCLISFVFFLYFFKLIN